MKKDIQTIIGFMGVLIGILEISSFNPILRILGFITLCITGVLVFI